MTVNSIDSQKALILLIYTGGTIGMIENQETGVLETFNFQHLLQHVPELKKLGHKIDTIQFNPPLDSADINPDSWMKIVKIISDNYNKYDGFVILHGTDTMVKTAELLESMLGKDDGHIFVFTGAMIPYSLENSDAVFNLGCALSFVQTATPGVYITMGGRLYPASNVRKNREKGIFEYAK